MTTFLLVISLLLNGVAIFSIMILYVRQNRLLEVEKSQQQMMKEMEEVISSYLFEIKEENEEFIKRVQELEANSISNENQRSNHQTANKKKIAEGNLKDGMQGKNENIEVKWSLQTGNAFRTQAVKAYKGSENFVEEQLPAALHKEGEEASYFPSEEVKNENDHEQPQMSHDEIYRDLLVNQVKLLQKQGLSSEEIARKMNKGKTEIELLLKFS